MQIQDLEKFNLPDMPGVYFFKYGEEILYVGKATSLRDRVKSYFDNNILKTRGLHIANMVTQADKIEFKTTRSVLEALLLENELIKKFKPIYNTKEKDDKSYYVLIITKEDFPRVLLVRNKNISEVHLKEGEMSRVFAKYKNENIEVDKKFGPYPSGENAREMLKVIRKIFPFRDKCEVFDKRKAWQKKPCFSYQIGLCSGSCAGVITKKEYQKQINRLIEFLSGNGEALRKKLEKEMEEYSEKLEFENAQKIKDIIFALEHVRDAHLIKRDKNIENNFRIEAYDISHISGSYRVGAMTVLLGSVIARHEYKKFKISTDKNDDLEGLKELLERRFKHLEWGMPNLIVLDGDERHINIAEKILEQTLDSILSSKNNKTSVILDKESKPVKVVAVVKGKGHKAKAIIGDEEIVKKYKDEIILVNSEVHRFALKYHRELRSKSLKKEKN